MGGGYGREEGDNTISSDRPGVSVVVAARNAASTLPALLDALSVQSYPSYEIICADDCSTDDTAEVVETYSSRCAITLLRIAVDHPGKKYALSQAISAASYDLVLCTDADCIPAGPLWIESMVLAIGDQDVVVGYGPLTAQGTLASWLAVAEGVWTAAHYLAAVEHGRPYMAVGRNLLYRRSAYHGVGGYTRHLDIVSGDDDLLLQDLAQSHSVTMTTDPRSWVYSAAPASLSMWLRQKVRHLSTATAYTLSDQVRLGIFSAVHLAWVAACVGALVYGQWEYVALVASLKWVAQVLIVLPWYRRLGATYQLWVYPIIELLLALFYLVLSPYLFFKARHW